MLRFSDFSNTTKGGPDVNRFFSMFSQCHKVFPRLELEAALKKGLAGRHARGSSSWDKFVAMIFFHLGRAHSLREIWVVRRAVRTSSTAWR